jgi:hypothetical protein
MRSIVRRRGLRAALAAAAATMAFGGVASADPGLKFPNERAACVAQAWVPFNTDPEVEPGALGAFISGEFAPTGEWGHVIRQEGCKP